MHKETIGINVCAIKQDVIIQISCYKHIDFLETCLARFSSNCCSATVLLDLNEKLTEKQKQHLINTFWDIRVTGLWRHLSVMKAQMWKWVRTELGLSSGCFFRSIKG